MVYLCNIIKPEDNNNIDGQQLQLNEDQIAEKLTHGMNLKASIETIKLLLVYE